MSGGAASGRKGTRYEQELVRRFHAAGWGTLRLPSSGSATDRDLPDVLAGREPTYHDFGWSDAWNMPGEPISLLWAIELKSGKATTLYVTEREVDDLQRFAKAWGATPLLGARFTTQASSTATFLVRPQHARITDSAYGLPVSDIKDRAYAVVGDGEVNRV